MGKRKEDGDDRTINVGIRMRPEIYNLVRAESEARGLSQAAFIRLAVITYTEEHPMNKGK